MRLKGRGCTDRVAMNTISTYDVTLPGTGLVRTRKFQPKGCFNTSGCKHGVEPQPGILYSGMEIGFF